MAEENQQVQQEMQQVTTKDPKKVEAGKRLAAHNCKKREQKAQSGSPTGVNQYYGIGAVLAGGDWWAWLLHLSNQERRS